MTTRHRIHFPPNATTHAVGPFESFSDLLHIDHCGDEGVQHSLAAEPLPGMWSETFPVTLATTNAGSAAFVTSDEGTTAIGASGHQNTVAETVHCATKNDAAIVTMHETKKVDEHANNKTRGLHAATQQKPVQQRGSKSERALSSRESSTSATKKARVNPNRSPSNEVLLFLFLLCTNHHLVEF
jgi:hypothetical protein